MLGYEHDWTALLSWNGLHAQWTTAALEAGKVDVVIGTHRLLSKDVRFHDLGLMVVDEEHTQWHGAIIAFQPKARYQLGEVRRHLDKLTAVRSPSRRTAPGTGRLPSSA